MVLEKELEAFTYIVLSLNKTQESGIMVKT